MKRILLLTVLFVLTILPDSSFAQQLTFNVKSFVINDSLKITDPVDAQLGRVNNFEIYLNNNDFVSIQFTTDNFVPLILFVSPSGSKNVFNSTNGKQITFTKKINETGNWELYIIGGKDGVGEYKCRVNFADSAALIKKGNLKECDFFRFVTEHSEADFIFIQDLIKNNFRDLRANGFSADSSYITKDGSLKIIMKSKNPARLFKRLTDNIGDCFTDWKIREGKLRKVNDNYIRVTSLIESGKKSPRFIKLTFTQNGKFTQNKISALFGKINE
jgi:hypothetical protein